MNKSIFCQIPKGKRNLKTILKEDMAAQGNMIFCEI